jgi:hypothetical protein
MARLRIKIELNPGGVGVRLDKLAKISEEFEKFLRSLAQDCGTSIELGEWLAKDFYDGSFGSMVEYVKHVEVQEAVKLSSAVRNRKTGTTETTNTTNLMQIVAHMRSIPIIRI